MPMMMTLIANWLGIEPSSRPEAIPLQFMD